MVYTPQLNLIRRYDKAREDDGAAPLPKQCLRVFEPGFPAFAHEEAARIAARAQDPWLLGYYSDNELPFPKDALDHYLKLPEGDPGRAAAEAFVAARPGGADAKITAEDHDAFRGEVAELYFSICAAAIRAHDPHHLYLGSRLHGNAKRSRPILEAAGRHTDVVAINIYDVWNPRERVAEWAAFAGKPILVTEWYAKGDDTGMPNRSGAGWTVPTQADRGLFYEHFALELLESGACVAWHWFKYADNDPLDLDVDPSNRDSNKGIVNHGYELYAPLGASMDTINSAAYRLTRYFDR